MFYAVVVVVRVEDDDADNFDKAWEKVSRPFAPDGDIMFVGEPWKVTSLNGDDDPEFGTFEAFVEHPGNPWMVPFDDLQPGHAQRMVHGGQGMAEKAGLPELSDRSVRILVYGSDSEALLFDRVYLEIPTIPQIREIVEVCAEELNDGLAQDEKFLRKFGPDTGN